MTESEREKDRRRAYNTCSGFPILAAAKLSRSVCECVCVCVLLDTMLDGRTFAASDDGDTHDSHCVRSLCPWMIAI